MSSKLDPKVVYVYVAFNHEVCANCRWRCFESPIFDKATWLWKQTQIADVWTEISLTLKYELQPTAIWEISTYFSFCHLVAGRKYSAYEESDGFAGPRAILPQIIQIQVKVVKKQYFFGWAFCYKRPVKLNDRDTRIPWHTQSRHGAI